MCEILHLISSFAVTPIFSSILPSIINRDILKYILISGYDLQNKKEMTSDTKMGKEHKKLPAAA